MMIIKNGVQKIKIIFDILFLSLLLLSNLFAQNIDDLPLINLNELEPTYEDEVLDQNIENDLNDKDFIQSKNKNFEDEVIVIGGAQIFKETIVQMKKLILTKVDCEINGDVYYPEINLNNFSKRNIACHSKNEENQFDFSIDLYEKI